MNIETANRLLQYRKKDESKPGGACLKNRCKPSGCVKMGACRGIARHG